MSPLNMTKRSNVGEAVRHKDQIRKFIWDTMQQSGAANGVDLYDKIPDFKRSQDAAANVINLDVWTAASVIKSNPDKAQRPLRKLALESGKIVYMAVPRLRQPKCFVEINSSLGVSSEVLSTMEGALKYGKPILPDDLNQIDLVISGSVAVNREGNRIGKGGGFADIEFALATEYGSVTDETAVLTTVDHMQILDESFPCSRHDVPVDYIVSEKEIIYCERSQARPLGIYWDDLNESKIQEIPLLQVLYKSLNKSKSPQ